MHDHPQLGIHHWRGAGCKVEGGGRRVCGVETDDVAEGGGHVGLLYNNAFSGLEFLGTSLVPTPFTTACNWGSIIGGV